MWKEKSGIPSQTLKKYINSQNSYTSYPPAAVRFPSPKQKKEGKTCMLSNSDCTTIKLGFI